MEKVSSSNLYEQLKELYKHYRTALMNRHYYGDRLTSVQRYNKTLEILIAIGTSSAIGGWAIWKGDIGQEIWAILTGIAAFLAILKPILNLTGKIERYSKLFTGHGDVFYDLGKIVAEVRIKKDWTEEMHEAYLKIFDRFKELSAADDPKPKEKLLRLCQARVNTQIPVNKLWMPKIGG